MEHLTLYITLIAGFIMFSNFEKIEKSLDSTITTLDSTSEMVQEISKRESKKYAELTKEREIIHNLIENNIETYELAIHTYKKYKSENSISKQELYGALMQIKAFITLHSPPEKLTGLTKKYNDANIKIHTWIDVDQIIKENAKSTKEIHAYTLRKIIKESYNLIEESEEYLATMSIQSPSEIRILSNNID